MRRSGRGILGMNQIGRYAGDGCRFPLAGRQHITVEIINQVMEQGVPVHFGTKMHKDRSQSDCSAVHQHEFARWPDAADTLQLAMDLSGKLASRTAVAQ